MTHKKEEKTIAGLRRFFTISVAAFEMQHTIMKAFGKEVQESFMHQMHLIAKEEINKENPDMNRINTLLEIMQNFADKNKQNDYSGDR